MSPGMLKQSERLFMRVATRDPFYYFWLIGAKVVIKGSLISGSPDAAGEVADIGLYIMVLFFRRKQDKRAQNVVGLGIGLLQQAIEKYDDAMAQAIVYKYAKKFEELATAGGLEGKIKQVVELRTALFIRTLTENNPVKAYKLMDVGVALLMAAVQGDRTWLVDSFSDSLIHCLATACTKNEQIVLGVVNRFSGQLYESLSNRNNQEAVYHFKTMQGLSAKAVEAKNPELRKIFAEAWIKALVKISTDFKRQTTEFVAEIDSNILIAIKNNRLVIAEKAQVGLDMLLAAVTEGNPKILEAISESWIHLLQRLASDHTTQGVVKELMDQRSQIFRDSITSRNPGLMNTMSQAIITTLRSAIKASMAIARTISRSWVLAVDDAGDRGGQVGALVYQRNAEFREAIANSNTTEAEEVSQVGVELVLAAISERKLELARELSLAWISSLGSVVNGGYGGTLVSLVEFKTKRLTEELIAGNNQEAELITKVWVELMLAAAASKRGDTTMMQTLSKCWAIAVSKAIQSEYQRNVDQLMGSQTKTYMGAIQRRNTTETDNLSMVGIELLSAAIRLKNHNPMLKNSLSACWVAGLAQALMVDRMEGERLVKAILLEFEVYMRSGNTAAVSELAEVATEILRTAQAGGNPGVVRLIKEHWEVLLR